MTALACAIGVWSFSSAGIARAAPSWTWYPNGAAGGAGGSGTWDLASPNWFDGSAFQIWDNVSPSAAVFSGGGTVSLGGGSINANAGISVSGGYTFENGTLNIAGGTVTTTDSITSFNTALTGSGNLALNIASGAVVELNASNSYSGTTTVSGGGTLRINDPHAIGDATITVGCTFELPQIQVNQVITTPTLSLNNATLRGVGAGSGTSNWNSTINVYGAGTIIADSSTRISSLNDGSGASTFTLSGNNSLLINNFLAAPVVSGW